MKNKVYILTISFLLITSGMMVVLGEEKTDRSVEGIEKSESVREIHDWHDLNEVRDDPYGDYILMNDLDEDTAGYDYYNTELEDYEVEERNTSGWGEGDTIDIPFDEEVYESISVEDDDGNMISHTVDHPTIMIEEDTGERYVYVIYENADVGWEPIGDYDRYEDVEFNGTFDGNGHEISGLYINRPAPDSIGLFGGTGAGSEITDVGLVDVDVSGSSSVGALVGWNNGAVENSYATGSVSGDLIVGGLLGRNDKGTVENSYATGDVSGNSTVGGLVGSNRDAVKNSYATGDVKGNERVGGLTGANFDMINRSYAIGDVSGDEGIGGLVGFNRRGTVENSYSTGDVRGNKHVGGLVGLDFRWESSVKNSYYNVDEVLINGEHHITIGGLLDKQYQDWVEDKDLDIEDYSDTLVPADDYYEISCLDGMRDLLGFAADEKYNFRLTEDVNLSGEPGLHIPYFEGRFDGNGHIISNLRIDLPFNHHIGMFGHFRKGRIGNLSVTEAHVRGYNQGGVLVGRNEDGTIENSHVSGNIIGRSEEWGSIGGLVGDNRDTVKNSYAEVDAYGNNRIGGLVGHSESGTEKNSYATGDVSGNESVGGLVGANGYVVTNSYATGNVTGKGWVGGLVGLNGLGTIDNSYATGDVSGTEGVGGLLGMSRGESIENSYATGDVGGDNQIGGLVGLNLGSDVGESYATGDVSGNKSVGGLIGTFRRGADDLGGFIEGNVEDTFATSHVSGKETVGGLIGRNTQVVNKSYAIGEVEGEEKVGGLVGNNTGTVEDSFWDVEISGIEESEGGTGLTTDEMTGENAPYNMEGFDFEEVWETVEEDENDVEEDGYPIFQELDREEQLKAQDVYDEEEDEIPGFISTLLLVAAVITVAIYKKKKGEA